MKEENTEITWEALSREPRYYGLPESLVKACFDEFDYAMGLRNGQIIRFDSASVSANGKWVHLRITRPEPPIDGLKWCFERGIDVRMDDIVWVADAPEGS